MNKKYGTPVDGEEIQRGMDDLLRLRGWVKGARYTHSSVRNNEFIDTISIAGEKNTYSCSTIKNLQTGEIKNKFCAMLFNLMRDGSYIEFTFLPELQRFEEVKYNKQRTLINGRCYSNEDIVDMQKNMPENEVLSAMNNVLMFFEQEGSFKKDVSGSPAHSQNQHLEKQ